MGVNSVYNCGYLGLSAYMYNCYGMSATYIGTYRDYPCQDWPCLPSKKVLWGCDSGSMPLGMQNVPVSIPSISKVPLEMGDTVLTPLQFAFC